MSGTTSAADIMSLACACYREPLRIQRKFQGNARLPDGLNLLLKIAAGDESEKETLCVATGASVLELREAANFFVKQVFFSSDANHYRVLGVDSDASIDQIKEHHRLLMRLFHPDRDASDGSWEDVYATRINQSYNVLRKTETRQQYDNSLKAPIQQKAMPNPVRRKQYYSSPSRMGKDSAGIRLPLVIARNLPQFVLGGVAVLAFLVIYFIYWPVAGNVAPALEEGLAVENDAGRGEVLAGAGGNYLDLQSATKIEKPGASARQVVPDESKQPVLEPALPVDARKQAVTPLPVPLPPVKPARIADAPTPSPKVEPVLQEASRKLDEKPVLQPRPVVAVVESPLVSKNDKAPVVREPLKKVAGVVPVLPVATLPTVPAAVKSVVASPTLVSDVATVKSESVSSAPSAISDREVEILLGRFVSSYDQGDLESFVALFDDKARTSDTKGKAAIRKDYEDLFSSSQGRQMSLRNIRWAREIDSAKGEGRFSLRIRHKNEQEFKTYTGVIRIELARLDNRLLIKGFFHDMDAAR